MVSQIYLRELQLNKLLVQIQKRPFCLRLSSANGFVLSKIMISTMAYIIVSSI